MGISFAWKSQVRRHQKDSMLGSITADHSDGESSPWLLLAKIQVV
jgi:hypothetical protein